MWGSTPPIEMLVGILVASGDLDGRRQVARGPNLPRQRMHWPTREQSLSDREFKKRYRLSKGAFNTLLGKLSPAISRRDTFGGLAVPPAICLSMTLRWLAGGSYLDIADMHGVAASTFFTVLWRTIHAITLVEEMKLPLDDYRKLRNASRFKKRQGQASRGKDK